jgi:Arc/MetJ family transcription regulator
VITSLDIDEELYRKAYRFSRAKTKKGTVDEALRTFVRLHEQAGARGLRGKLIWKGDLDELREDGSAIRR